MLNPARLRDNSVAFGLQNPNGWFPISLYTRLDPIHSFVRPWRIFSRREREFVVICWRFVRMAADICAKNGTLMNVHHYNMVTQPRQERWTCDITHDDITHDQNYAFGPENASLKFLTRLICTDPDVGHSMLRDGFKFKFLDSKHKNKPTIRYLCRDNWRMRFFNQVILELNWSSEGKKKKSLKNNQATNAQNIKTEHMRSY